MTATATLADERGLAPYDDPSAPPSFGTRLAVWLSANRAFTAALAIALVLRVVVAVTYPPVLEFTGDSPSYLAASRTPFDLGIWHPFGYPVFLWVLSGTHSLALVAVLQHAMGLAAAVLVYRLVRSFSVGPLGGTLAAAPLLFDAYQLDVEQFVLSDTVFTFMAVGAVTLAVRVLRTASIRAAVALGALLALAALTRTVGLGVAVAVVAVLLIARAGWSRAVAVAAACAVPIGAYALAFHATYGVYGLQGYGGRYLYGLVGQFASCERASLPVDERGLCPTLPTYARPGVNQYVWSEYNLAHVPGSAIQRSKLAGDFARPIAVHQLGDVVSVTTGNLLHFFAPGRETGTRDWFAGSWQFPVRDTSPAWNIYAAKFGFQNDDYVRGRILTGPAQLLRDYQRVFFVPGPALLLALLAAAATVFLRRADRVLRATAGLCALAGLALLALPSVSAGFDWRYLLPAQALLVPAGVLGISALWSRAQPLVRSRLGSRTRAAAAIAAVLSGAALVAPGLAHAGVISDARLHPAVRGAAPATLPLGGRALVRMERPVLVGSRCAPTDGRRYRLLGLIAIPTSVTYESGRPLLVQPGNVGLSNGEVTSLWIPPHGAYLPNVVVSSRYPTAHGTVYAYVDSPAGTMSYVDPLGAGAAAWSYRLASPPHDPALGQRCSGSSPWAGMQLRYLRITGVAPFIDGDTQVLDYGLTWQPWRADSYDLRFRVASPSIAPQPWQYPRSWQRTTLTEQSLVDLTPGVTYCFSVRARDELGAVTDWSVPRCTARMYDDAALPTGPDWTHVGDHPGFSFGTYTATRSQNATVSVAGTFSRVSLRAYRCPDCGVVDVYAGTTLLRSVDLASSPAAAGLFTWTSSPLVQPSTSLTLRVRSRDKLVAIDGFGLLR